MTAALRWSVVGMLFALPAFAADGKALLAQATAAESSKQFDKALDAYLKAYLTGERTNEVRERIHDCFRQAAQAKRHRDPAFREYVLALPPAEALNLYAEVVEKLSTHHAEKEKAKPERLFALSLQEIERALGTPAFRKQNLAGSGDGAFLKNWRGAHPATPREARIALQELVRQAQAEIGLQTPTSLILEAICGACAGLDESTSYIPPTLVKEKSTEPTITRAEMVDTMAGVGLIAIGRFREGTAQEFDRALSRLRMEGLRSLVIDLRGNTGGSFSAAIQLAERFVPSGVLATTIAQVPEFDGRVFSSGSGMAALDVPLVVLVDARTMSAAEVFASAVKEQNRATLIGVATFGKGSVQSPLPLDSAEAIDFPKKPRSGLLIVTLAKVFQANGAPLHEAGVTPHVQEANPDLQLRLGIERAADLTAMR